MELKANEKISSKFDCDNELMQVRQSHEPSKQQRSELDSVTMQDDFDDQYNWPPETFSHNISFSYSNSPVDMEMSSLWVSSADQEFQNSENDDGIEDMNPFGTLTVMTSHIEEEEEEADDYSKEFYDWNCILEEKYHPQESLKNQPQVQSGNRTTLIAWLSKLIRSEDFYPETLFLTVDLIDRFLVCTPVALECLQLLGLSALFIAAKQLEMYHPALSDLLQLGAGVFSKQHFLQMERIILKQLQFHLVVATSLFFVEYYISYPSNKKERNTVNILLERPFRTMVRHLAELCIQDYHLCQYPPSCLALASMALIEEYAMGHPTDLTRTTYSIWGYPPAHLKKCTTEIWLYLSRVLAGPISDLSKDTFFDNYCTLEKT